MRVISLNQFHDGYEVGYEVHFGYVGSPNPRFYTAAWRIPPMDWKAGHIGVDTIEEIFPLAVECIDFNAKVAREEMSIGRELTMDELKVVI